MGDTGAKGRRVWLTEVARSLAVGAAGGVFLGLTGAFGTDEAGLPIRMAYWIGLCLGGALAGAGVTAAATRIGGLGGRRWLVAGVVFAALTVLLTPAVWAVTEIVFGGRLRLEALPYFVTPVAVITAAMTTLTFLLNRAPVMTHAVSRPDHGAEARSSPPSAPTPVDAPPAARFLDRLPPKLRGGVLFGVESEDHYLRLHTSRGQDLILMRLADALIELEGLEGAQTHRSWWVARDGFDSADRGDGRAVLTLRNGAAAPVSRTYAKALRQAGWF